MLFKNDYFLNIIIKLMSEIILNVGGKIFKTTRETINKYPDYPLSKIIGTLGQTNVLGEYFIDRNPKYFEPILDYYRTNILVKPKKLNMQLYLCELDYWNIENLQTKIYNFINWSNVGTEQKFEEILNNEYYAKIIYDFIKNVFENSNSSCDSNSKCIYDLTLDKKHLQEIINKCNKYFNIEFKIIKYKIFENRYVFKNNIKTKINEFINYDDDQEFLYELYIVLKI